MTTQASTRGAGGGIFALPGAPDWVDGGRVVDQMVRRASSFGFDAWCAPRTLDSVRPLSS
jgi:hypothetical protein